MVNTYYSLLVMLLTMRVFLSLGVFLIPVSPAFSSNLLIIKCAGDVTSKVVNTNTSDVIQENKGLHNKIYIIDRERRMVMAKGSQWLSAQIIDGVLTGSGQSGQGVSTSAESITINIEPIGAYTYEQSIKQKNISMDIDAMGQCEKVDSSVLYEPLE